MGLFILRRTGVMLLTAICLTFIVFVLTNLYPNLEKLAKTQGNFRMSEEAVASYLGNRGMSQGMLQKYGEWIGVLPGYVIEGTDGVTRARCAQHGEVQTDTPKYCGVLQGYWGQSWVFKEPVADVVATRLGLTGKLMAWVFIVMVPGALIIGVLAGMREGTRTDRTLSTGAIITTATPEYVSGVIFIAIFTSSAVGLKWFKGSATSAMDDANLVNFTLPVLTIALYGMGYIARMTRASMAEVMTAQYIRTARLKGVSFPAIVM
ncbi:MAG: ABC transporter permease, partial [Planktomarina sp.]